VKEIWREIKEYNGDYLISNLGKIKSIKNNKVTIKKQWNDKDCYLNVSLYFLNKKCQKKVHRLVAQEFLSNPENKPQINHIDGNKQNNNIDNLEWCTNSENMIHAYKTGLREIRIGENGYNSKLTESNVRCIRLSNVDMKNLANIYNVTCTTIFNIKKRKTWRHVS